MDSFGNVGGRMKGGKIVVGRNAGDVGWLMEGGTIIIHGVAGWVAGSGMWGGNIHLSGDYTTCSTPTGGRIYHKGQAIFDKLDVEAPPDPDD